MKKTLLLNLKKSLVLIFLLPTVSFAHVKWFAEGERYVEPYKLTDTPVIFSILLLFLAIIFGFWIERKVKVSGTVSVFIERTAPSILSIASIGFGLSFLIFSFSGFVFAPNLIVDDGHFLLILIQALAGSMILFGVYERTGGLILVALFMISISVFGVENMLDTLEMLGFAFYAMIIGRPKWRITESEIFSKIMHHFHEYGVSVLRIGTGINLMILGFSEKILNPSLTQSFLEKYDWNFMQELGFGFFSDYWFAYFAGGVEFLIGLFLLLGFVTRLSVVSLAIFLVGTLVLLGPIELVGHLPHFSIASVLLVFGSGSRFHFCSTQQNK